MIDASRTVFISYRRDVSWQLARLVFQDLRDHGFDPFMDVETINSGEFEDVILTQIAARAHFLVVIEPGSLDRISAEGDWLRREISHAIGCNRNIVPVIARGFSFHPGLRLPPDIDRLPGYNCVEVLSSYFDASMERLRERFLQLARVPTLQPAPRRTRVTVARKIRQVLERPARRAPTEQREVSEQVAQRPAGQVSTESPAHPRHFIAEFRIDDGVSKSRLHVRATPRGPDAGERVDYDIIGYLGDTDPVQRFAGSMAIWPLRFAGVAVGARRVALDLRSPDDHLFADGETGPPPYIGGLTIRGRRVSTDNSDVAVTISVDAVQLLDLWLRFSF